MRLNPRVCFFLVLVASSGGCDDNAASEEEPAAAEIASTAASIVPELPSSLPSGVNAEAAAEGRELYVVCSVCHGLDGAGTQLGPSLRDNDWIHISGTPEEIVGIIRTGVPTPSEFPVPMPPMGGGAFDDHQLQSLVAYLNVLRGTSP
jgi:mono/diheme cytochrome c family protein